MRSTATKIQNSIGEREREGERERGGSKIDKDEFDVAQNGHVDTGYDAFVRFASQDNKGIIKQF